MRCLKMKDYRIDNVSFKDVEELLFNANSECGAVDILQGSLVDNYFCDYFDMDVKVYGHRVKARKHFIATETYLNCWSSTLTVILTDNDKEYYTIKRNYLSDYLKENKENKFLDKEEKEYNRDLLHDAISELKK